MFATCHNEPRLLSRELTDFARRQIVNAKLYKGDERRVDRRHLMSVPVWLVPVDEENRPVGEPVQVISRDVSSTGIGLFHEHPIQHERLAIQMELAGTQVALVIQLVWMRPMGPFYGSAGKYLEKLEEFPTPLPSGKTRPRRRQTTSENGVARHHVDGHASGHPMIG